MKKEEGEQSQGTRGMHVSEGKERREEGLWNFEGE